MYAGVGNVTLTKSIAVWRKNYIVNFKQDFNILLKCQAYHSLFLCIKTMRIT